MSQTPENLAWNRFMRDLDYSNAGQLLRPIYCATGCTRVRSMGRVGSLVNAQCQNAQCGRCFRSAARRRVRETAETVRAMLGEEKRMLRETAQAGTSPYVPRICR